MISAAFMAIALAVSPSGGGGQVRATTAALAGGAQTAALYAGIPQHGVTLGSPRARVTLIEFADPQCPFCRQYSRAVLPGLVRRYVRSGRVKLVFRNLSFIGPDSGRAARVAAAAGLQNRLWQFIDLLYKNQGEENTGYATDAYLRAIAMGAGVNADRALRDRSGAAVRAQLGQAGRLADAFGVRAVPAFLISRDGQPPRRLQYRSLSLGQFTGPIDAALRGR